jgi:hypothetical protein
MSQIVRIRRTQMVEKEYLLQALTDLGYAWEEGGQIRGRQVDIKLKGREIGFRSVGHSYSMLSRGRAARLVQKVSQRYAYLAARAKLEAQGFTLASETREKGQIHLVLRRMA